MQGSEKQEQVGPWGRERAEAYLSEFRDWPVQRETIRLADLLPDDHVLEVGCGGGAAVQAAAEIVTDGTVVAFDPSPTMIAHARARLAESADLAERVEFGVAPAESLPVEPISITVALAINSLSHWATPAEGLGQVCRALVPGGRFIVATDIHDPDDFGGQVPPLATLDGVVAELRDFGMADFETHEHEVEGRRFTMVVATKPVDLEE